MTLAPFSLSIDRPGPWPRHILYALPLAPGPPPTERPRVSFPHFFLSVARMRVIMHTSIVRREVLELAGGPGFHTPERQRTSSVFTRCEI